ncbi:MAG: PilZ domain-containing protein [Syntrophobacteria bacterium]
MQQRARRKSLRAPVYLDVRCDLPDGTTLMGKGINLGTEGIFIKIAHPIKIEDRVTLEFLLPDTMNSVRLAGETVWTRSYQANRDEEESFHVAGVRFIGLVESYRSLLRDFTLRMLADDEALRRQGGILRVLEDIRNLPSMERLKAYTILTRKYSSPLLR